MFKPEQPIKSYTEDQLGRYQFGKSLSQAILSYKEIDSIVVGLFGPWGCGKTSLLNMVLEQVIEDNNTKAKKEKTIIVRFNPWNFSDQNQLISQFFKQLSIQLKRKDYAEDAQKAGAKLETYSQFFLPLTLIPSVGPLALLLSKLFNTVGKSASNWGALKSNDLNATRLELNKLLKKLSCKILIVIDDIDRLNNTEIRQVFQLIKSLGDFPNTIYLVAFDKNIVVNALKKVQEGSGEEYLEKMVQIPFEVPPISKDDVEKLLFSQIDDIIKDIPENKWDQIYWGNIYNSGVKYFFNNLRDVTRYINSLRFNFQVVKDEVNPIDFIALTCLQVFLPNVYSGIRDNKSTFTGTYSSFGRDDRIKNSDKAICNQIFLDVSENQQEFLKDFLKRLFPKLESIYDNMNYGYDWIASWRKEGRICSPDVFDIFFRLQLPKGEVSRLEIESILFENLEEESFRQNIMSLSENNKIIRFLERFEDYTRDDVKLKDIELIIKVLMDLGDTFPNVQSGTFGMIDTPLRVLRIVHQLIHRIDNPQKRYEIIKKSIEESHQSINVIVKYVHRLGCQHGKQTDKAAEPPEKQTVTLDSLNQLEAVTCSIIDIWASDGRLQSSEHLPFILYQWRNWQNSNNIDKFISDMIESNNGLIQLIESFMYKSSSQGISDYVAKVHWNINLSNLGDFIDIDTANMRLETFKASDQYAQISDRFKLVIATFLDTYSGKRNDPFYD